METEATGITSTHQAMQCFLSSQPVYRPLAHQGRVLTHPIPQPGRRTVAYFPVIPEFPKRGGDTVGGRD